MKTKADPPNYGIEATTFVDMVDHGIYFCYNPFQIYLALCQSFGLPAVGTSSISIYDMEKYKEAGRTR